ncbi:cupin domain-containing protein [Ferrovibrio sp.]|uniref:cupin domain-containing protein n=1 Tax=Ferrovibrio sp. TaxID=1917215 RepID=UPI003D292869
MRIFQPAAYAVPVSPNSIRADHPGFSFATYTDPPGQVWDDFRHDDVDEFVVVAEGRVEIEVGQVRQLCGPGDLVRIPAGARHSLRTTRDAGSVWHYGYGRFGAVP